MVTTDAHMHAAWVLQVSLFVHFFTLTMKSKANAQQTMRGLLACAVLFASANALRISTSIRSHRSIGKDISSRPIRDG